MKSDDSQRVKADIYIGEAIRALHAVQMKHLDHTDMTTVREALEALGIVRRAIAGPQLANETKIVERLREVANAVGCCVEPSAELASADIQTAAKLFQAMVITEPR